MVADNNLFSLGNDLQAIVDNRDDKNISVFGLHLGQKIALTKALVEWDRVVYVCDDYFVANRVFEQLKFVCDSVVNLPSIDDVLTEPKYNNANAQQRLHALTQISQGARLIVVTVGALCQPCGNYKEFVAQISRLEIGDSVDPDKLNSKLIQCNYARVDIVTEPGQFSWRGDIVDIWVSGESRPLRLDFFGDNLEGIKQFDPSSRLTIQSVKCATIAPNCESGRGRLGDFFGRCTLVFDDARLVADAKENTLKEHNNRVASLLASEQIAKGAIVALIEDCFELGDKKIAFHRELSQNRIFAPQKIFDIKTFAILDYSRDYKRLVDDIELWHNQKYTVSLCAGNPEQASVLQRLVSQHNLKGTEILVGGMLASAVLGKHIVVGQHDLFKRLTQKVKKSKAQLFTQIEQGDYVVHVIHGIGLYDSTQKLDISGTPRDYLIIKYKNNDTLYVPVENMDSLSKYSSSTTPVLNRIGGQEFAKVKDKVKKGVHKMALDLLELYAKREQSKGTRYAADGEMFGAFENAFEYTPTECQAVATREVISDLQSGKIMDRLLCGDVGYGKTEVAMRAAFYAVLDGKQVAFVCPTTILAKQHYATLTKRMTEFGVKLASFTRFESVAQIKANLQGLQDGSIDIAVGTHRLLQKDVSFKQLGVLVLDEEQRFGVADKEKIKRLKSDINVLTLSATPIPRTLHMSLQSIRDISTLDTPPKARLPVQTYVAEYSPSLIKDAILRELGRGGAAFVVYNNVCNMPQFVTQLQALMPNVKFAMAHGQQTEEALEDAVNSFVGRKTDVLVASTIIENGIDMPHANTMVVVDADRLGLAQMYQLRGRVGRAERQAYAYFTYNQDRTITATAYKRLDAITEFTEFGSGFKLAMRDLEIRGAGNILGREQHGHMDKVGYDMYCKLLQDTIKELKSGTVSPTHELKVITDLPSFVPDDYVQDRQSKLDIYGRLQTITSVQDRENLYKELTDIFGTPPVSVANLLTIALFKNLASSHNATKITLKKSEYSIFFDKLKDITPYFQSKIQTSNATNPKITFKSAKELLVAIATKPSTKV